MSLARLNKVKKYYGDKLILDIDKLEILDGDRIGLVGVNGAGKTTLIKSLLGQIPIDEGNVYITKSFAYINQSEISNEETLNNNFKNIFNAPFEYHEFLSGGEKVKFKIAKALSENKHLIIADEPTANLDERSIETLENMLKNYNGSLLLVSHDRRFLDSLCNTIIEIEDGKIKAYKGNYSKYLELKTLERQRAEIEYNSYINEKKHLENAILNKRNLKDSLRKTPKRMGNSEARLHKMGPQRAKKNLDNNIKALRSRIDHLDIKEKPKTIKEIKIRVQDNLKIASKNLIEAKDFTLFAGNKLLLKDIKFKIKNGKKVALIGDNGCGKSTLLKNIVSKEDNIKVLDNVVIGYFDQSQKILKDDESILKNILKDCSYDESFVRINLDGFGFKGEDVFKKVSSLSGGEKVKVALCKILLSDNNLIILDEPTNYLDIKSMESLETALINCNKTLIVVSHDRNFVSNVCDYILEIDKNLINEFSGTYNEYIKFKKKPKLDDKERANKDSLLILENRLSNVISLLSIEPDNNKKSLLENEYYNLLKELKNLRKRLS
ncbi:ABC-F type ribosomal protection protein CplR [Clostridium perfringens]|uniref:ABC-F type ribosomal protection protein CplR n=1 Tax=Clostridium perfringens TaxID=1502 RepID=UPI00111ED83A|nr:ABC-F type ribosomal protection protein CplR [Clostridium perfringens]TPE20589.1 ABC-F family ATP-binding cassette domain-containing protein [Clostridium perfringens]